MKKTTTYRLSSESDKWLAEQARKESVSKNTVLQLLVNEAKAKDEAMKKDLPPTGTE